MPIEFNCSACQQFLRVPDEAAGKKAKCPKCQQVLDIPLGSAPNSTAAPPNPFGGGFSPLPSAAPPKPSSFGDMSPAARGADPAPNPYASPGATVTREPIAKGDIRPSEFDISEVLNVAWEVYKREFGLCLGATLLVMVVGFVFNFTTGIANGVTQVAARDTPIVVIGVQAVVFIAQQLFQMYISAGTMMFYLRLSRRDKPEIGELFNGLRFLGPMIASTLIMWGGLLLLAAVCLIPFAITQQQELLLLPAITLIPMIYVLLTYGMSQYLIVDRNLGALEALQLSAQITPGNRLRLVLLGLLMMVLSFLGLLACFVGLIFVIPLITLMVVMAYRSMIGENIRASL